jgi:putative modified peptide
MTPPQIPGGQAIKIEMTPTQAAEFVERLATDEAFRTRYQNETQDVLAEYGVEMPDDMIPEKVELPDPESLQQALAALREERPFTISPDMGMAAAVLAYQCFVFMKRH